MQFTHQTLSRTSKNFSKALNKRGLELSFTSTQNTWAQIVAGKDFSAAMASTNKNGFISAVPVSTESIQSKLNGRNRDIDSPTANDIFTEAISEDLPELSSYMAELVMHIKGMKNRCLIRAFSDKTGLGVIDAEIAGYLPLSNLHLLDANEHEVGWLKSSSDVVVSTVNALAGINLNEFANIFATNFRVGRQRNDHAFAQYFGVRVEPCCQTIVEKVLKSFDLVLVEEWEVDFDEVRDIVFDVIERDCRIARQNWLSPECALAEALIDHLGARLRETIRWLCDQPNGSEEIETPFETLMQTARISMEKLLKIQSS